MIVARAGGLLGLWPARTCSAAPARGPLGGRGGRRRDGALALVAVQHRARQLRGPARRGGAVGGDRAPRPATTAPRWRCATAAALMRPEAWPFLFALRRSGCGARYGSAALCRGRALVPLLWFGPDVLGAGGALGASHTARGVPSPGSAKLADVPVRWPSWATPRRSARSPPWSSRCSPPGSAGRWPAGSSLAALAWVVIVAVMTTAGYAGNPRYLVAAAALGAALAGAGAVRAATRAAARLTAAAARGARRAGVRPASRAVARRRAARSPRRAGRAPLGALVLVAAVLLTTGGTPARPVDRAALEPRRADAFDRRDRRGGRARRARRLLARSGRARGRGRCVAWRLDLPMRDMDKRAGARPRS